MNLRQKSSRYGAVVLFCAGITGCFLVVSVIRSGFKPDFEIWLACGLVVSLILHARASFALSRARQELDLLRGLVKKISPSENANLPDVAFEPVDDAPQSDAGILRVLQDAIEQDRIDLYLQPIVSLPQRKTRYFEAFSRLRKEDGGVLSPDSYLDAAERANRISVIDNLILLRAVQALRELGPKSAEHKIFCNVSPATVFDQEFFERFADYLDTNEGLCQRIVFEFTYPAVEMMHRQVQENLKAVADRGFTFSVDHIRRFDLNWTSLSNKNFRFVKAPASLLLSEAAKGEEGRARVEAFRQALSENNIDLIVEKVERESQMPEITRLNIDYGQGNVFGLPMKADAYLKPEEPMALAS